MHKINAQQSEIPSNNSKRLKINENINMVQGHSYEDNKQAYKHQEQKSNHLFLLYSFSLVNTYEFYCHSFSLSSVVLYFERA